MNTLQWISIFAPFFILGLIYGWRENVLTNRIKHLETFMDEHDRNHVTSRIKRKNSLYLLKHYSLEKKLKKLSKIEQDRSSQKQEEKQNFNDCKCCPIIKEKEQEHLQEQIILGWYVDLRKKRRAQRQEEEASQKTTETNK